MLGETIWRRVSFVNHLELEFSGNVSKNAIALGDVDNDGKNELIVGNQSGDLAIFKGRGVKPWRKAFDLGMISAIGVGDLCNLGQNSLVVINGEGWCYVFNFGLPGDSKDDEIMVIKPVHTQRIPANVKVLLLGDINDDGVTELVIALTDRVVRTYQWATLMTNPMSGKLIGLNKWEFANQIGTVTMNVMQDGSQSLLVAHPGGTFIRLKCQPESGETAEQSELLSKMSIDYHPLSSMNMRNPNISTEIIGNIARANRQSGGAPYAVATLDGTLMFVQDEQIVWSIQVADHQLFALCKLDITGNGNEEIIVCSWDGHTYIINQNKHTVRFQFEQPVSTFLAGHYTLDDKAVPCLVYVTFNNKIHVYYDIQLPRMVLRDFKHVVKSTKEMSEALASLPLDSNNPRHIRELYKHCLYGMKD